MCKVERVKIKKTTIKGETGKASPRMRKGTKITASCVSSVGTVTPHQICQEHSSLGGRTPISTRCKKVSFRNNRNMVTSKRELAIRTNRRDDLHSSTLFSLPRRHHDFSNSAVQEQNAK
jgi:hypothetical protein